MQIPKERRGHLPPVDAPESFTTPDGRRGWRVTVPGGRPLATPAVADGRVFVGGGFGSYEFYAFDAATGRLDWAYQTADDGPTAAVVEDGFVIFNTESCELEVLTVEGRPAWKHWLGDPLMSMPAAGAGCVVMAYPDSRGDRRHYLACFDLRSGNQKWRQPIPGEVITAPVIADGQVYAATLDGTILCANLADGAIAWQEGRRATSAPAVWGGRCFFSERKEGEEAPAGLGREQYEHIAARGVEPHGSTREYGTTTRHADWLHHAKRSTRSPRYMASAQYDMAVGFGGAKGDSKMHQAMDNLGKGHVHEVWSYQGTKSFLGRGRLYSSPGDTVQAVDPASEQVVWERKFGDGGAESKLEHGLTPPSVVGDRLFVGGIDGAVRCLDAGSGETLWTVPLDHAVVFQPAVAGGKLYAGTEGGLLVCVETGEPSDDGWRMWGATAAHNGLVGV